MDSFADPPRDSDEPIGSDDSGVVVDSAGPYPISGTLVIDLNGRGTLDGGYIRDRATGTPVDGWMGIGAEAVFDGRSTASLDGLVAFQPDEEDDPRVSWWPSFGDPVAADLRSSTVTHWYDDEGNSNFTAYVQPCAVGQCEDIYCDFLWVSDQFGEAVCEYDLNGDTVELYLTGQLRVEN